MRLTTSSLVAAAAVVLLSCAPKGEAGSITIYQVCQPADPDTASGACPVYSEKCATVPLGTYTLDTANSVGVFPLALEVHNQLTDNTSDTGGTNTHNATVDGFSVSYSASGATSNGHISQAVPSEGSSVVGIDLVDAEAFPELSALVPAAGDLVHMTATIVLRGKVGDTSSFRTPSLEVGLDVCNGCLPLSGCPKTTDARAYCPGPGLWPSSSACVSTE
jgi:hypothetical protein